MASFRQYALERQEAELTLAQRERDVPKLAPSQILIRVKAASLNYRYLLTIGDAGDNREGLLPLSDGAGEVVTRVSEVGERYLRRFDRAL